MKTDVQEKIVYSNDLSLVNIEEYDKYIFHVICTDGEATFTYNDKQFVMGANDIAVIALPCYIRSFFER